MEKLNKVLTVDPGWNTGLAYWVGNDYPLIDIIKEPPRRKKIKLEVPRIRYMMNKFEAYIKARPIEEMIIEGVEMWTGSVRSMTSAARGDLFGLAYLVGGYMNICFKNDIDVKLVYPRGGKDRAIWKGQMNAEMVAARIHRINKNIYPEHIREAVGIGFAAMGVL